MRGARRGSRISLRVIVNYLDSCADHSYSRARVGGWQRCLSSAPFEKENRMKKKGKKDEKKDPKKGK